MPENGNGSKSMSKFWEWGMKLVIASFLPILITVAAASYKIYDRIGDHDIMFADQKESIEVVNSNVDKVDGKVEKNTERVENMQEVKLDIRGLQVQLERIHEDIKEIKELQYRRMSGDHP